MIRAKKVITRYLNQNCAGARIIKTVSEGVYIVEHADKARTEQTLTMNIFCDIMDVKTKQIIARSDLPHDIMQIGYLMPTSWTKDAA